MSFTILTIPFNLKEKEKGKFLERGFVIDEILEKYFEIDKASSAFLHVATFDDKAIIRTAINLFIEKNFSSAVRKGERINCLFKESAFYDKPKYLPLAHGNVSQMKPRVRDRIKYQQEINEISIKNFDYDIENVCVPIDDMIGKLRFIYKNKINEEETNEAEFEIDKIKIFINKSQHIKDSLGFGFIEIVLKWNFANASQMMESLEPISEFFRFYGKVSKNEFEVCWNNYFKFEIEKINREIQETEKKINEGKIREQNLENQKIGVENKKLKINKLYGFLLKENVSPQKITFKILIDRLLGPFKDNDNRAEIFDFLDDSHKPYILHLSSYTNIEEESINEDDRSLINFNDTEFIRKSYRLVRIPGADNKVINKTIPEMNYVSPDLYSNQFILNEGGIIIEGIPTSTDLPNKYYPAFLLALNQKYLFNYLQEKINKLPLEKSGRFKIDDIKKLQETMIYSEFTQVFTSLSNYHEIDVFFDKLRERFKVGELKEEYLASINGLSKIMQLNFEKEEENKRVLEESKAKLKDDRLQALLFVLTIIQILPIIYDSILAVYFEKLSCDYIKAPIYVFVLMMLFSGAFVYLSKQDKNTKNESVIQ